MSATMSNYFSVFYMHKVLFTMILNDLLKIKSSEKVKYFTFSNDFKTFVIALRIVRDTSQVFLTS